MKTLRKLLWVMGILFIMAGTANALPLTSLRITEEGSLITHSTEWNTLTTNRSPIGVSVILGGPLINLGASENNSLDDKNINLTLNPGDSLFLYTESFKDDYQPGYWLFNADTYRLFIGEGGTEREIWKFAFNSNVFSTLSSDPNFTLEFLDFTQNLVGTVSGSIPGLAPDDDYDAVYKLTYNHPVPEPATMFLLGSGLIGVGVFVRRKFKK